MYFSSVYFRFLHWLAAAGRTGWAGGVPVRAVHAGPQRQRQGGLQRGGQEVSRTSLSATLA